MTITMRTILIAAAILAPGLTGAEAQTAPGSMPLVPPNAGPTGAPAEGQPAFGGSTRPAQIPPGYKITPFGYFHSSCVMHLAEGDEVRANQGVIRHSNGSTAAMPKCAYPHFRADGQRVVGDEQGATDPNISHAWVEDVAVTTTASYGELFAEWSVPPTPTSKDGQTLFYFPGLEDINHVVTILQPVLGWNSDYSNAWGIASWNCCQSGTVYESTPQPANPGDTILGYIFDTCAKGTLSCATWDVVTWDLQNGKFSQLLNTSSFTQTFNWAFGGVLEVYNIKQCTDYPSHGSYWGSHTISFNNVGLYDYNFAAVASPKWYLENRWSGLTPQCSYAGATPSEIRLSY